MNERAAMPVIDIWARRATSRSSPGSWTLTADASSTWGAGTADSRALAERRARVVERFFNKLKQFRRIATRYEKFGRTFLAFVHVVSCPHESNSDNSSTHASHTLTNYAEVSP